MQTLYSACCITTFARLFGDCEKYALSTKRTTAVVNVNSKISLSYRRKKSNDSRIILTPLLGFIEPASASNGFRVIRKRRPFLHVFAETVVKQRLLRIT